MMGRERRKIGQRKKEAIMRERTKINSLQFAVF
jgi:hypothetical protein